MHLRNIVLGLTYRDRVSGFVGVAFCRTDYMNGTIQIGVNPGVDDKGKLQDREFFDYQRMERYIHTTDVAADLQRRDLDDTEGFNAFDFGDKVKDDVTGLEGIVTARAVHIIGCVQVCIQPQAIKDGVPAEAQWFDWKRLRKVDAPPVEVRKQATGCEGGDHDRNWR